MKETIFYKAILLLIFCCTCSLIWADPGEECWRMGTSLNAQLREGPFTFEVEDKKYGSPTIEQTHFYRAMILLEVDEDFEQMGTIASEYSVALSVRLWYTNGTTEIKPIVLTINYDPDAKIKVDYRDFHQYEDVYKMEVIVNFGAYTGAPLLNVIGEICVSRDYQFNCANAPTGLDHTLPDPTDRFCTLAWDKMDGAAAYDVEWTFYHEKSAIFRPGDNGQLPTLDFEGLFKNNTTRVTVSENNYDINLLYPDGWIFYRVRGVRTKPGRIREFSRWTGSNISGIYTTFPNRANVAWHQENEINFQSSVAFAEDGKNVPSVQYFDGTLRGRQSVVLSNSDVRTTLSQTIYDYHGRPAVQVMPAPSETNIIGFDPDYAAKDLNTPFTKQDFDRKDCTDLPTEMSTQHGASKYYSPQSTEVSNGAHQYLPDAEHFPYTITEYTPDLTGRIRRQSGVGAAFKLGSGKETKYYYGKPAQAELDQLFGNEVGVDSHYLKNAVVDPNGQVSISYIDAHGRIVATSLAGNVPENVNQIDTGFLPPKAFDKNILNNTKVDNSLVSVDKIIMAAQGNMELNYTLDPTFFDFNCATAYGSTTLCYDCLYDLEIIISDGDCNEFNGGFPIVQRPISFSLDDITCGNNNPTVVNIPLMDLPIGEYTITKRLRVSDEAMIASMEHFLDNNACIPEIVTVFNQLAQALDFSGCEFDCEQSLNEILGLKNDFINVFAQEIQASGVSPEEALLIAEEEYNRQVAEVMDICRNPTECEIILENLKNDLMPGGQYATFETTLIGIGDNQQIIYSINDPSSIFYDGNGTPLYQQVSDNSYLDENGDPDQVRNNNGNLVDPNSLEVGEFIENFKPSWVNSLLPFHPEYCLYMEWCPMGIEASQAWNQDLEQLDSYLDALNAGITTNMGIDPSTDPYFSTPQGMLCLDTMMASLLHLIPDNIETPSLLDFVTQQVFGPDCTGLLDGGGSAENDFAWQLYKTLYLSIKRKIIQEKILNNTTCPMAICNSTGTQDFTAKICRIPIYEVDEDLTIEAAEMEGAIIESAIVDACSTGCAIKADLFLLELRNCPEIGGMFQENMELIRANLIAVCQSGCSIEYPNGTSTTPDGSNSFEQIIRDEFPIGDCFAECNPWSISTLNPFGVEVYNGPREVNTVANTCACDKLGELKSCFVPSSPNLTEEERLVELELYLRQFSLYSLSIPDLQMLEAQCADDNNSIILPNGLQLPAYLECDVCQPCEEIVPLVEAFKLRCDVTDSGFGNVLADYLNHQLGFSLSGENYADFYKKCQASNAGDCQAELILCPLATDPDIYYGDPCIESKKNQAKLNAEVRVNQMISDLQESFKTAYRENCLNGIPETFQANVLHHEYHFTLYYYDQADNLVQTVPPKGVKPLTAPEIAQVAAHRSDPTNPSLSPVYPAHSFLTQYAYNTLNQVVLQDSPDAVEKEFWYDDIGRIVASRDGRQKELGVEFSQNASGPIYVYSYTIYDRQGRIIEVGEKITDMEMTHQLARSPSTLENWLLQGSKVQITRTYYDEAPFQIPTFDDGKQDFLRPRVAAVTFEDYGDGDPASYDYATHYSYDASGNIKTLVQEITALHPYENGYKRMDYDYDYISGNVHAVFYQKGKPDQFTHRYEYDSNNRLINVYSSLVETDLVTGSLWDREATYEYYLHGPMSRMEIGQYSVQGCDYAYTLQGWLKGVNAGALVPENDIGQDGTTEPGKKNIARDALNYTLSYYDGDYKTISGQSFEMNTASSALNNQSRSLYNGNIRYMTIHNKALGEPIAYSYQYDQLHRIKGMTSIDNADVGNFTWGNIAGTSKYGMTAKYDGNGNILDLTRTGILPDNPDPTLVNDLDYQYRPGTNLLVGTTENAAQEDCKVEEIIETPINESITIESIERIVIRSEVAGSETVLLQTGQRICMEPGFGTNGIGGRFAAVTGQPCETSNIGDPITSEYVYDSSGNLIFNADSVKIEWTPYGKVKKLENIKKDQGAGNTIDNTHITIADAIEEDANIQACSTVTASSTIDPTATVVMEAGKTVTLLEGFCARPEGAATIHLRNYTPTGDCETVVSALPNHTHFGYDAVQNRVLKSIQKNNVTTSTFYIRDGQGNMMATYRLRNDSLLWKEQHIYGSSRLGILATDVLLDGSVTAPYFENTGILSLGSKRYELSNHLGNVLAVVSDRKQAISTNGDNIAEYYEPIILSANDYYPFGLDMPSRTLADASYRFGFNGKEADRKGEWGGDTHYDYGFRIYNPEIGRFLSVDPLAGSYPMLTPYQYASNRPIDGIDIDGLEYITYVINWYEDRTKPEVNLVWFDEENHNYYGEKGAGILYGINYWKKSKNGFYDLDKKNSKEIFYSREEGKTQYGFYYGAQSIFKISREGKITDEQDYYSIEPVDGVDRGAWLHDQAYGAVGSEGKTGFLSDWATTPSDFDAIEAWQEIVDLGVGGIDPYNLLPINEKEHERAKSGVLGFTVFAGRKKYDIAKFISGQRNEIEGVSIWPTNKGRNTNFDIFKKLYFEKDENGFLKKRKGYWEENEDGGFIQFGNPIRVKDVAKSDGGTD